MNMIKRNLGFAVFFVVVLILAGGLFTVSRRAAHELEEKRETFSNHQDYFSRIANRSPGVTRSNLSRAQDNLSLARQELQTLNRSLAGRSSLETSSVSAVEAKNRLDSEARRLASELRNSGIEVAEEARGFSFRDIIQAPGLPEETREAPALMRQMNVVSQVMETIADSDIEGLISVNRPAGIREIRQDAYNVIRLHLELSGSLDAVRELVNSLHEEPDYYFSVPFFEWEARELEIQEAPGVRERDEPRRRSEWRREAMDSPRTEWERDAEMEQGGREMPQPRERRLIRFDDTVRVAMPVHFIEFKPDLNQEN